MPKGCISLGNQVVADTTVSEHVKYLVNSSWSDGTQSNYKTYVDKWQKYCSNVGIPDPSHATFEQGAEFLAYLYNVDNAKYWTIAGARSALSAILPLRNGVSFGKELLVSRLVKGVFKRRPSLPKHVVTYDANIVLVYMKTLAVNKALLLETLTKKLCMLLCLLSGQRSQTIPTLSLGHMHVDEKS